MRLMNTILVLVAGGAFGAGAAVMSGIGAPGIAVLRGQAAPLETAAGQDAHAQIRTPDRPDLVAGPQSALAKDSVDLGRVAMRADQVTGQAIDVAPAQGGTLRLHLLVNGTITADADRIARVPARVVGTVSEMRKRLGDRVEKDEVVAVLDSREVADAKSEFLTSSVRADLEKTNFDRQQSLWDKRISSEQSFLQAKATYTQATLAFDLARQKLSALGLNAADVAAAQKREEVTPNTSSLRRYELRSPIKGRIVERKVDIGTTVGGVGDPSDLYTLTDLTGVWIELAVATVELPRIPEGATVVITPSAGGDTRRAEGRVMFISPLLNLETRSARVVVALPNPDLTWRPGTFVTAEIEIAKEPVAVRLPKAAFQTLGGRRAAFVRTPTGFVARAVEIGRSDDDFVEVVSGVSPGEDVAVGNTFLLKAELGKSETDR